LLGHFDVVVVFGVVVVVDVVDFFVAVVVDHVRVRLQAVQDYKPPEVKNEDQVRFFATML
jgi:hypothetical protein